MRNEVSAHTREVGLTVLQATLMTILAEAQRKEEEEDRREFKPDSHTVGCLVSARCA